LSLHRAEWARRFGVQPRTLSYRMHRMGLSLEHALRLGEDAEVSQWAASLGVSPFHELLGYRIRL
jgi:hypothetical protein